MERELNMLRIKNNKLKIKALEKELKDIQDGRTILRKEGK